MAAPMIPATAKGEATRDFILSVAAEVFADRGYVGAKMSELFEHSGLTKGAFYFYFASKQDLAIAVVERKQIEWLARVDAEMRQADSAIEALRGLGPAMLALHRDDPSAWSVSRLCRELAREPEAAGVVRRDMRGWVASVERLLRAAEADLGRPLPGEADALAAVVIAAFDGLKELSTVLDGDGNDRFESRVGVLQAVVNSWLK